MLAKKYKSEIISILNPFEEIYTLEFRSLSRPFKYHPGQFLHLALDEDYDGIGQWPESRCFSMQSNPNEETIRITYAVKGEFTKQMEQTLQVGDEVWLKLPYGDLFQQPHSKENTVFVAGGTGITPFLSLFTHESFTEYTNPKIYLGFRSKSFNIYKPDLNFVKLRENSVLLCEPKIVYEDDDGVLNIQKILTENGTNATYFISGPPAMIKSFKDYLVLGGVKEELVLTDDWE